MALLKKNLIFGIVVLVCLLAFAAGAYLAYGEFAKIDQAEREISTAQSQLKQVLNADPAPTEANIEASRENVAELAEELEAIRTDLQQGERIQTSDDGIEVMTSIQRFINDYEEKAKSNLSGDEEEQAPSPIELPEDFAFGFEQYIDESTIPDDTSVIPVLDKQRQILSYLFDQLFSADPHSMVSVKREVVENNAKAEGEGEGDRPRDRGRGFQVNEAVSAGVPGAIETLGFSLTFTGYTDTLREFLNSLANFDLPIVVRSIEVDRSETQAATAETASEANNLDSIFGVFGGGGGEEASEPQEVQKPVIAENVSSFTVIVEFIEIILPEESEEETL